MKRNALLVLAITASVLSVQSAATAQFTITIPKIPKVKKERTQTAEPTPERTQSNDARAGASGVVVTTSVADKPAADWRIKYHADEVAKLTSQVNGWVPADSYFPSVNSNDDYFRYAVSPSERAAWFKKQNWTNADENLPLVSALDELKVALQKRLPENQPDPKAFKFRNAAEEKMIIAELEVPGAKIFKIGLDEPSWLIDKNEYGLPTSRYKHAMIWGRNPAADDGLCRFWYINVIQDYSGGGRYGATHARFIRGDLAGCPAGK